MIEPISAVGINVLPTIAQPQMTNATDFSQMLGEGVGKLDSSLKVADQQLRAMAAGKEVAVHDVMISMEEARMNLMFMVEVRNRCVEAYQELMRMQL
ncbi:MAG: flagellar hook-basal body complex protein FliE [Arenimonas sp.]